MKKRLYTKQYVLTRQGVRVAKEVETFVRQLVAANQTADPHDLRSVVVQALELPLLRYELDTHERARKRSRNAYRK